MDKDRVGITLGNLRKDITFLKKRVAALEAQKKIHKESNLFVVLRESGGRKRRTMSRLLSDERAFKIAVKLLLEGHYYGDVVKELDKSLGFKIGKSSVGRFWDFYRQTVLERRSER